MDGNGNILSVADSAFTKRFGTLPPAAGVMVTLKFGDPRNELTTLVEPEKLLILFRSTGGKPPLKNFRFFLKDG